MYDVVLNYGTHGFCNKKMYDVILNYDCSCTRWVSVIELLATDIVTW